MKRWIARLLAFAFFLTPLAFAAQPSFAYEILNVGEPGEPDSLDPHKSELIYARIVNQQIWLPLVTYDRDGNMIGGAAETWDTSKDGLTYIFHLKAGLKWSDGTPITAADYGYSFRRMEDPKTLYNSAQLYYWIKNAEAVNKGKMPLTALGIAAPDARTVVITLARANPLFINLVSAAYAVPEKVVEKWGAQWTQPEHLVCAGAYVVKERVPGTRLKLVKNPNSIYAKTAAIDEINLYFVSDDSAMIDRYRTGAVDLVYSASSQEFDQLKKASPGQAIAYSASDTDILTLNTRKPRLNDARVRQALSLLIDRTILASKVVGGGATPAFTIVPEVWTGIAPRHDPDYANWQTSTRREEAKKLLSDAGYNAQKPLAIEYIYYPSKVGAHLAVAFKSMWDTSGLIKTTLLSKEQAGLFSALDSHDFEIAGSGFDMGLDIDPYDLLSGFEPGGWYDRSGFKSADYETVMDKVRNTADPSLRASLLADADTMWSSFNVAVPLVHIPSRWFIAPAVKGWTAKAEPYFFRNLSIERASASAH